jgi:hypothetical protein
LCSKECAKRYGEQAGCLGPFIKHFNTCKSEERKRKKKLKREKEETSKIKEKCLEFPIHGPHLNKLNSIASN